MTNYTRVEDEAAEDLIKSLIQACAALTNQFLHNMRPEARQKILAAINSEACAIGCYIQLRPMPEVHGMLVSLDKREQPIELFCSTVDPDAIPEKVLH